MIPEKQSLDYRSTVSRLSPKDRILRDIKIMPDGGCWEWQKSITQSGGYGQLTYRRKVWRAHCLSYTAFVGPINDGLCVLHNCDNTRCVNPKHLFLGTRKENTLDMMRKGRHRTNTMTGPRAKITERDAVQIRTDYRPHSRKDSMPAIAKRYGISVSQVLNILQYKCWKDAA